MRLLEAPLYTCKEMKDLFSVVSLNECDKLIKIITSI
jgi:hypothetical protein